MRVFENEYGISITGNESERKPGTFYFEGASAIARGAFADGMTNLSVRISEKGAMLSFTRPLPRKPRANQTEGENNG